MNVWSELTGNNEYCAEISDLKANGLMKSNVVTLPDGTPVSFSQFQRKTDEEGDITHWAYNRNGTTYTVLND